MHCSTRQSSLKLGCGSNGFSVPFPWIRANFAQYLNLGPLRTEVVGRKEVTRQSEQGQREQRRVAQTVEDVPVVLDQSQVDREFPAHFPDFDAQAFQVQSSLHLKQFPAQVSKVVTWNRGLFFGEFRSSHWKAFCWFFSVPGDL